MKKIFVLVLIFVSANFAQIPPIEYYPLHVGNKWEYMLLSYEYGDTPDTNYFTKEIIGTKIMDNDYEYYIVNQDGRIHYERYDTSSNEIKYYSGICDSIDQSIYSLNYSTDSVVTWNRCNVIPTQIYYEVDSNNIDSNYIMIESDYFVTTSTIFVHNIGIINSTSWEGGMYVTALTGAIINGIQWGELTYIDNYQQIVKSKLFQNHPNPFNPKTYIEFHINKSTLVKIIVYDSLGRIVNTLFNGRLNSGHHNVMFDGSNLSSGVYYYRLITEDFSETKKLVLLK